ncbi:hypothetical protein K1T71_006809 [Dendrolimus kikuchii]|uniref:Uncharacterized protein n=1 Tax=Dendrolimus kikuchii TaxID=765133 RepID=A0ACC1D276_9NEOP|nr:hypothetical protein K1T71_006809 [Dendrolimus kikuchii]
MAAIDTWSEEKCMELIHEFKAKTILWDPSNPCFFKKKLKPIAWDEIAQMLNTTAEECKHKMGILMSSFRREKSKIVNSLKSNTDPSKVYKSTWFAFEEMAFLMDRAALKQRLKRANNQEDDKDDLTTSVKKSLLQYYVQTPIGTRRKKQPPSISKIVTVRPSSQTTNSVDSNSAIPEPGPSTQAPEERDEEIKSFINFIGNKMKRYSDVTKNAVQEEICDVIFKADRNFYEERSNMANIEGTSNTSNYEDHSTTVEFATIDFSLEPANTVDPLNKFLTDSRIIPKTEKFSDSE